MRSGTPQYLTNLSLWMKALTSALAGLVSGMLAEQFGLAVRGGDPVPAQRPPSQGALRDEAAARGKAGRTLAVPALCPPRRDGLADSIPRDRAVPSRRAVIVSAEPEPRPQAQVVAG